MRDIGIYAPAVQKRWDYQSWNEVPKEFKTRTQWLKAGRRVKDGEQPQSRVCYPRIVEAGGIQLWHESVLEDHDDLILVTDPPTNLFHFNQTVAYHASSRTQAYEAFKKSSRHSRKDSFGRKTDSVTGNELADWITVTAFPNSQHVQFLNSQLIRQHINQKQIVGVKGTKLTRFILIDLDYHGRDQASFEAQAEVLLNAFHGRGTWHFQVKQQDVTGLQMIFVFAEPKELQIITEKLETILKELDQQHPELAMKAKAAGMKTLAELEIYPDPNQAVRLPLCRDREMLLHKALPLVTHRNQQVQDVEGYIRWIEDPNREYMPKDKVLDYLHYFSFPATAPKSKPKKKVTASSSSGESWNGNLKRWLCQFWIEGNSNARSLNEHIAVLSRLAACYGHSQEQNEKALKAFVAELPVSAKSCSTRLLKGKLKNIDRVIESTAKFVCEGNGHQDDPGLSTKKLKTILAKWTGFDPLNKSTWGLKSRSNITPNWTDEQKQKICVYLRKPLFVKDDDLILKIVNGIVNLTIDKEREGNGWHKNYLQTWMKDKFPTINCGKAQKRQAILVALQELGVIHPLFKGRPKLFVTRWALGEMAQEAIGEAQGTTETPS